MDKSIDIKIDAIIKIVLIVLWFSSVDSLIISFLAIFFNENTLYLNYVSSHQYIISFISKIICFVGIVYATPRSKVIEREDLKKIRINNIIKYIFFGVIGWLIGTIIVYILMPVFPEYEQINNLFNNEEHIFRFVVIVLVAPFIEEYIFRGKIQNYLKSGFGISIAITIQAVIFARLHGLVLQQIYAFVLGIYLGFIKEKEKNFISTFTIHVFINFIGWYVGSFIN